MCIITGVDFNIFLKPESILSRCDGINIKTKLIPSVYTSRENTDFKILKIRYSMFFEKIVREVVDNMSITNVDFDIQEHTGFDKDTLDLISSYSTGREISQSIFKRPVNTHRGGIPGSPRTRNIDIYPKNIMGFRSGSMKKSR